VLKVKSNLVSRPDARVEFEEKADQLRVYSGSKYRLVSEAPAGTVCAVLGPTKTYPGQGLGVQPDARQPMLEPVLNYRVELPEGADPHCLPRRQGPAVPSKFALFPAASAAISPAQTPAE
jgi:hypothetical protein